MKLELTVRYNNSIDRDSAHEEFTTVPHEVTTEDMSQYLDFFLDHEETPPTAVKFWAGIKEWLTERYESKELAMPEVNR